MEKLFLENMSSVPRFEINKMVNCANLPNSKLLLAVGDEDIEGNSNLGEFVPREYLDDVEESALRISHRKDERWSIGIVIYKKASDLFDEYPSLFTFLLGHELGHAKAYLANKDSHPFGCLIRHFIRDISEDEISDPLQLPHEIAFDKFGKYISETVYGSDRVTAEVNNYLKRTSDDPYGFKNIANIISSDNMDDIMHELILFAKPYKDKFRSALCDQTDDYKTSMLMTYRKRFLKLLES